MFCSTIIPTIGRPTLSRTVQSVLDQAFTAADFEIIVVNDSGQPLPEAKWQESERVQILSTNRCERSVARNTGAAVAQGEYLHFLDDDDRLLPRAMENFWVLAQNNKSADWLYGSSQLVDRQEKPLIQLHHNMNGNCFIQAMAGEWFPLQSSCIKASAFFAIGGFHPLVLATQDIDLCRRITLNGNLASTSRIVSCIGMGVTGSTTDYNRAPIYSRWAREKILNQPQVFTRMRTSASSGDWYGRIVRTYLTSAVWNLQHGKPFTAVSRALFGLTGLALAGHHVFSNSLWQAMVRRYESKTFLKGFQEIEAIPPQK